MAFSVALEISCRFPRPIPPPSWTSSACGIDGAALASLEWQGRYITRPALAMNALRKLETRGWRRVAGMSTPQKPCPGRQRAACAESSPIFPRFLSFSHRFPLAPLDRNAYKDDEDESNFSFGIGQILLAPSRI